MDTETMGLPSHEMRATAPSVKQVLPTPAWFVAARSAELPPPATAGEWSASGAVP